MMILGCDAFDLKPWFLMITLQGINISHLGERKIIFKSAFGMGYVSSLEGNHDWFLVELYFPDSDLMMFQLLQTSESWTPRTQGWPEDAHCGHSGQCGGHDPVGWVCTYPKISQMAGGGQKLMGKNN